LDACGSILGGSISAFFLRHRRTTMVKIRRTLIKTIVIDAIMMGGIEGLVSCDHCGDAATDTEIVDETDNEADNDFDMADGDGERVWRKQRSQVDGGILVCSQRSLRHRSVL
jgi:hypothetical protein